MTEGEHPDVVDAKEDLLSHGVKWEEVEELSDLVDQRARDIVEEHQTPDNKIDPDSVSVALRKKMVGHIIMVVENDVRDSVPGYVETMIDTLSDDSTGESELYTMVGTVGVSEEHKTDMMWLSNEMMRSNQPD